MGPDTNRAFDRQTPEKTCIASLFDSENAIYNIGPGNGNCVHAEKFEGVQIISRTGGFNLHRSMHVSDGPHSFIAH